MFILLNLKAEREQSAKPLSLLMIVPSYIVLHLPKIIEIKGVEGCNSVWNKGALNADRINAIAKVGLGNVSRVFVSSTYIL